MSLAARAAKEILRLMIEFILTTTPQNPTLAVSRLDSGSPCPAGETPQ